MAQGPEGTLTGPRIQQKEREKAITGPLGLQVRLQIRWSSPSRELQRWKGYGGSRGYILVTTKFFKSTCRWKDENKIWQNANNQ